MKKTVFSALFVLIFSLPGRVWATNGYLPHGYGVKSSGMAGAGVALPQEALIAAINPAGIAFTGNRIELGASIFSPRRSYTVNGIPTPPFQLAPGQVKSGREYFGIPEAALTWQLNPHSAFGLILYANGGMNTSYSRYDTAGHAGTFGAGSSGVDLAQMFLSPTYAYRFDNGAALGLSAVLAYQRFAAKGITSFGASGFNISNDSANLSDRGHDHSFGGGINLGFILPLTEQLTLGGGYRSRIYMQKFDKYRGLFAQQGDFDIPASATLGLAWKTTPRLTLALDVQKTWYSKINSVGNTMAPAIFQCLGGNTGYCLGANQGIGFGWRDMTTLKFGLQYAASREWTWRLGYSYGRQPIPASEVFFNILAPGVMEEHFTAGLTKTFDHGHQEINLAVMLAPAKRITGPISATQTVTLKMKQYQLQLGWTHHFP